MKCKLFWICSGVDTECEIALLFRNSSFILEEEEQEEKTPNNWFEVFVKNSKVQINQV